MKKLLVSIVLASQFFSGMPAQAANQLIFTDHFDDGVLDPAWQFSFTDANAWDFDESIAQPSSSLSI